MQFLILIVVGFLIIALFENCTMVDFMLTIRLKLLALVGLFRKTYNNALTITSFQAHRWWFGTWLVAIYVGEGQLGGSHS